jgi:hypothetical protein
MTITRIDLIKTTPSQDVGLFVNGKYIIAADPSCGDDATMVSDVAERLALAVGVESHVQDIPVDENWNWDDIKERLFSNQSEVTNV